jgi:hypothetical protein
MAEPETSAKKAIVITHPYWASAYSLTVLVVGE